MRLVTEHKHEVIALGIADACRVSGMGRSWIYAALADKRLASVRLGRRRLIKADSLRALIDSGGEA
jgi:excisionase family DNA binding protein